MNGQKAFVLECGRSAYIAAAAAWKDGERLWLDPSFSLHALAGKIGAPHIRLVRYPSTLLAADLSLCEGYEFPNKPTNFSRPFVPVQVGRVLVAPLSVGDERYVSDLKPGQYAYMRPGESWLWRGKQWIDGYSLVSPVPTEERTLRVVIATNGAVSLDEQLCPPVSFSRSRFLETWPDLGPDFPLAVN